MSRAKAAKAPDKPFKDMTPEEKRQWFPGSENLKNMRDYTPEERYAMNSRGGKKAQETKRRKKELRELTQDFLLSEAPESVKTNLRKVGFGEEDMTNLAGLVGVLFTKALASGDLNAARTLIEWAGMAPMQQIKENEAIAKLEQFVAMQNGTEDENAEDVIIYLPDNGRDTIESTGEVVE